MKIQPKDRCYNNKFCRDFMESRKRVTEGLPGCGTPYAATNAAVSANNTITANLTNPDPNDQQAANLLLELTFYQEGIMRVNISCPGVEQRFSISSTGIGVEWSQLV